MIYLDSSVALAQLLSEDRCPPPQLWREELVASRLLEYEVWVRLHARGLAESHAEAARLLLGRITFIELVHAVLERARKPFPLSVRTLDALHLATFDFFHRHGQEIQLATYDQKMSEVARRLGLVLYDL